MLLLKVRFCPFVFGMRSGAPRFWACCGRRQLALTLSAIYAGRVMEQPFVNVEEKIDRFVGKRTQTPDALSTKTSNKADALAWQKAFQTNGVPRGVYRFKTHEEADEWLWRMITRQRAS